MGRGGLPKLNRFSIKHGFVYVVAFMVVYKFFMCEHLLVFSGSFSCIHDLRTVGEIFDLHQPSIMPDGYRGKKLQADAAEFKPSGLVGPLGPLPPGSGGPAEFIPGRSGPPVPFMPGMAPQGGFPGMAPPLPPSMPMTPYASTPINGGTPVVGMTPIGTPVVAPIAAPIGGPPPGVVGGHNMHHMRGPPPPHKGVAPMGPPMVPVGPLPMGPGGPPPQGLAPVLPMGMVPTWTLNPAFAVQQQFLPHQQHQQQFQQMQHFQQMQQQQQLIMQHQQHFQHHAAPPAPHQRYGGGGGMKGGGSYYNYQGKTSAARGAPAGGKYYPPSRDTPAIQAQQTSFVRADHLPNELHDHIHRTFAGPRVAAPPSPSPRLSASQSYPSSGASPRPSAGLMSLMESPSMVSSSRAVSQAETPISTGNMHGKSSSPGVGGVRPGGTAGESSSATRGASGGPLGSAGGGTSAGRGTTSSPRERESSGPAAAPGCSKHPEEMNEKGGGNLQTKTLVRDPITGELDVFHEDNLLGASIESLRDLFPHTFQEVLPRLKTIGQVCVVRRRGTRRAKDEELYVVVNTHLFYHPDAPHVRLLQVAALLRQVTRARRDYPTAHIVFAGDLNSHLGTAAMDLLRFGVCCYSKHVAEFKKGFGFRWGKRFLPLPSAEVTELEKFRPSPECALVRVKDDTSGAGEMTTSSGSASGGGAGDELSQRTSSGPGGPLSTSSSHQEESMRVAVGGSLLPVLREEGGSSSHDNWDHEEDTWWGGYANWDQDGWEWGESEIGTSPEFASAKTYQPPKLLDYSVFAQAPKTNYDLFTGAVTLNPPLEDVSGSTSLPSTRSGQPLTVEEQKLEESLLDRHIRQGRFAEGRRASARASELHRGHSSPGKIDFDSPGGPPPPRASPLDRRSQTVHTTTGGVAAGAPGTPTETPAPPIMSQRLAKNSFARFVWSTQSQLGTYAVTLKQSEVEAYCQFFADDPATGAAGAGEQFVGRARRAGSRSSSSVGGGGGGLAHTVSLPAGTSAGLQNAGGPLLGAVPLTDHGPTGHLRQEWFRVHQQRAAAAQTEQDDVEHLQAPPGRFVTGAPKTNGNKEHGPSTQGPRSASDPENRSSEENHPPDPATTRRNKQLHKFHDEHLEKSLQERVYMWHNLKLSHSFPGMGWTNVVPGFVGFLDHILISQHLRVVNIAPAPDLRSVQNEFGGLPNRVYPSDHLCTAVDIYVM